MNDTNNFTDCHDAYFRTRACGMCFAVQSRGHIYLKEEGAAQIVLHLLSVQANINKSSQVVQICNAI